MDISARKWSFRKLKNCSCYLLSKGMRTRKYAEVIRWFTKAAELGHFEACVDLGHAYQIGP